MNRYIYIYIHIWSIIRHRLIIFILNRGKRNIEMEIREKWKPTLYQNVLIFWLVFKKKKSHTLTRHEVLAGTFPLHFQLGQRNVPVTSFNHSTNFFLIKTMYSFFFIFDCSIDNAVDQSNKAEVSQNEMMTQKSQSLP